MVIVRTKLREVPKTCEECPFKVKTYSGTECYFTKKYTPLSFEEEKKNKDCPITETEENK